MSTRLAQAFCWACAWDVAVAKPGNVSHASAGHRMQARQFLDSAEASAPALTQAAAPVGERIEAAVAATWARVGCNTNLGILLLCAPTAWAAQRWTDRREAMTVAALRSGWQAAMSSLCVADAAAAFRGIAQARPGGLGEAPEQDVQQAPTMDLRAAMGLAAEHDRIARQYRDAGAELFDLGLSALGPVAALLGTWPLASPPREALAEGPAAEAVLRVFLAFLASAPDSHIVRKHGPHAAQTVMREAQAWWQRARAGEPLAPQAGFVAWDQALKAQGLNPGSSADLTVATLFLAALSASGEPLVGTSGMPQAEQAPAWHGT